MERQFTFFNDDEEAQNKVNSFKNEFENSDNLLDAREAEEFENLESGEERVLKVRLDKWLWAARFFKTRALARAAVEAGKVFYNNERSKPSREIEIGATLHIRQGRFEKIVIVKGLSTRRRSTDEALALFEETEISKNAREAQAVLEIPIENYYEPQSLVPNEGYYSQDSRERRPTRFLRRSFQRQPNTSNTPSNVGVARTERGYEQVSSRYEQQPRYESVRSEHSRYEPSYEPRYEHPSQQSRYNHQGHEQGYSNPYEPRHETRHETRRDHRYPHPQSQKYDPSAPRYPASSQKRERAPQRYGHSEPYGQSRQYHHCYDKPQGQYQSQYRSQDQRSHSHSHDQQYDPYRQPRQHEPHYDPYGRQRQNDSHHHHDHYGRPPRQHHHRNAQHSQHRHEQYSSHRQPQYGNADHQPPHLQSPQYGQRYESPYVQQQYHQRFPQSGKDLDDDSEFDEDEDAQPFSAQNGHHKTGDHKIKDRLENQYPQRPAEESSDLHPHSREQDLETSSS